MAVVVDAGLRVSETVNLYVGDMREDLTGAGILHVRHGKGGKHRLVPISASVVQLVKAHLADTGRILTSEGPLSRAHDQGARKRDRKRLTAHAAGVVVGEAVRLAGVDAILGHANVTTTQRYLDHLELEDLKATVPALPAS